MWRFVYKWLHMPAARLLEFIGQQRAQTLAEYGLLITLIAVAVVVASMLVFRNELVAAFTTSSGCLDGGC